MVIAHHLIWTACGWWLPNDPRGSGSQVVRNDVLKQLGTLHLGRKTIQPKSCEVRNFYAAANKLLTHPLLSFGEEQIAMIGGAFASVLDERGYTCYACAIMPDHVHMVIRKHKHLAEEMMEQFQSASRKTIVGKGKWGLGHPVFALGGWKGFLDGSEDVWRTIRYVEENPIKLGLPRQSWKFVTAYDNWPFHKCANRESALNRKR